MRPMRALLVLAALACMLSLFATARAWGTTNDKVLLSDVRVLTLYAGKQTAGRRSSPVPQLNCVGGDACGSSFRPETVQCVNKGADGSGDFAWECKADLDMAVRFGTTTVTCEGYDYPDDPYVLKGSCGLEYTLAYTQQGRQQQQHRSGSGYYSSSGGYSSGGYGSGYGGSGGGGGSSLVSLLVLGFVIYVVYTACANPGRATRGAPYGGGGGGGGAGGGHGGGGGGGGGYGGASCGPAGYGAYNRGGGGGMGGFWGGAGLGGLMGYMMGRRGGYGYGGYNRPRYGGGGGFRMGGGGFRMGGGGGGTRTASGFGGTRRR